MKKCFKFLKITILILIVFTLYSCKDKPSIDENDTLPSSITLLNEKINFYIGDTYQINAKVNPDDANQGITYQSSNAIVATIDSNTGLLQALSVGTSTITLTSKVKSSITKSLTINVFSIPKTSDEKAIESVSLFLNSLDLNYSFDLTSFLYDNSCIVTEYGLYDELSNTAYGSAVRASDEIVYTAFIDLFDDSVEVSNASRIYFSDYQKMFSFKHWYLGDSLFSDQLIYDEFYNTVYADVKGHHDEDLNFIFDHNSVADYIVSTTFGEFYGEYTKRIEFVLDDNYQVSRINAIIEDGHEEFEYLEDYLSESNENVIFYVDYFDIGTSNITATKEYYLSGREVTFGTRDSWTNIITRFANQFEIDRTQEELSFIEETLREAIPNITQNLDSNLDFEFEYVYLSFFYYSRSSIKIYSVPTSDVIKLGEHLLDIRTGFKEEVGHRISRIATNQYIYVTPYYNYQTETLTLDFYIKLFLDYPEQEVNNYIHNIYGSIDIPVFTGAPYFRFINLSGYGFVYVLACFDDEVDITEMINYWGNYLVQNGWYKILTARGIQYQDPSKRIAIEFNSDTIIGKSIFIDFLLASPGSVISWPYGLLQDHNMDIIPLFPAEAYSVTYNILGSDEITISILNNTISFASYIALLSNLGFTKVFNDPMYSAHFSFLSSDLNYQVSFKGIDLDFFPVDPNTVIVLTIYPSISEVLSLSNSFPIDNLKFILGEEDISLLPVVNGTGVSYALTNSYYFFGMAFVDSIVVENFASYYVTGLTNSEKDEFISYFYTTHTIFNVDYLVYLYMEEKSGFGVRVVDFNDGTLVVGGVRVSRYFNEFDEIISYTNDKISALNSESFKSLTSSYFDYLKDFSVNTPTSYQYLLKKKNGTGDTLKAEIDMLGMSEEESLELRDYLFPDLSIIPNLVTYTWLDASAQIVCTWKVTKYLRFSSLYWFVVTIAYIEGSGTLLLFEYR
ncbi:MAG: Ig-like domain-containing protein [Acholeplasmatales bacterium]|jgi:hypothetical protein|nr:Ig-like domain-containing protein [Acholeplasmatales bacterium]